VSRGPEYPDELYDEWWAQGCPRNESGDPILLDDACDYCPLQWEEDCGHAWEHCPHKDKEVVG